VKTIQANGIELRCVDQGGGLPLLLVHGFPLDHSMWAGQIEELSSHCRVIAPDLRGFGASPAVGDKVTMDQFADDLAALLDGLDVTERIVYCGLSMGGYIAFQFWRRYHARLRGLVLCDTRAVADLPEAAQARFVLAERTLREGPGLVAETMIPRLFTEATRRDRPELVDRMRSVILANDPRGIAAATRGMAERPDMTEALAGIDCPTLVLVGRHDVISPPDEMQRIARAIPNASFVDIADAGHMAPMENPAEVNAALRAFVGSLRSD
jgi:3-oxoadipate enol-lactonase